MSFGPNICFSRQRLEGGADMSSTAVASGLIVFVLSVVQGEWTVTYSATQICALKGSTVEINCIYRYPFWVKDQDNEVEQTFWFAKLQNNEPVDLRTDSEYSGRVQYDCGQNDCTLRITDLRESDSAEYKFRFTTNQPGGKYTGSPGVTLSVTGLEVRVKRQSSCLVHKCSESELTCHSSCPLPRPLSYVWYRNGHITTQESQSFKGYFYSKDVISCAVKNHEDSLSPSVCVYGETCKKVNCDRRSICAFKGSSVEISCTYNSHAPAIDTVWFTRPHEPLELEYSDRIEVLHTDRRSTLRIRDLTETDSAQYCFIFRTRYFEWGNSYAGTTLTVTDPDLQVQVVWTSAGPKLVCHSSCFLSGSWFFTWYKNKNVIGGQTSPCFSGPVDPEGSYSCSYEGHHSAPVYAPTVVSLTVSLSGVIMEGRSITLTCSSDANPAAKYRWYKEDQILVLKGPHLVLNNLRSSDSGQYHCTAENELGRRTSGNISINVEYPPKNISVSVSPSAEMVEGSSVNLSCSSDANPAANITWYKEDQILFQGAEGVYHFSSIRSEDGGIYHCRSKNQFGQKTSPALLLDVQYPPKNISVSVSPSAEMVEGSSVNLTCSSDANPAANITWYKEGEDSPKASGQIFTITDLRPEHSGNYYCEVQNTRGRRRSALYLTFRISFWKSAASRTITAFLLVLIVLAVLLWIRRKKSFTQQHQPGERPELNEGPPAAEQQDDLHYSSISFSQNQADVVYSNIRAHPCRETQDDWEEVEYSAVRYNKASSAAGTRHPEDGESFQLYSTVQKRSK
ncbi:B-cell receptor CD22-like isoform X2 [Echeneis naucrates]|uniref:B-cell receptor CD22-like isoform X2 n=1 Tax=Echeneis naucrates TaxID=173247 RepID=UPI0011134E4D|nr:B-cell receptor CD22-like isoform X2 [Echeneis naucrates]